MMKPVWPLSALVLGSFGFGTTEFAPMGLLPDMAGGLHVSIPKAGMLVTAYAVGVMVGAPVMTLAFDRIVRKTALLLLMAIFTIGNLLTAIAPDFLSVMLARVVTAVGQGAFFGLGAMTAASLVPESKRASAIAVMFLGLALANIVGVATATVIGQLVGWRTAFTIIAAVGVASIVALVATLPATKAEPAGDVRQELRVLTSVPVLAALATTALAAAAMFSLYTYITPVLAEVAHASSRFITAMLVLIGIGFAIGNTIGGRMADWSVDRSLFISLGAIAAIMAAIPLCARSHITTAVILLLWGVAFFATTPAMQLKVMLAAKQAPALASSVNIGAFNLGNAIGAAAGGAALTLDLGYASIPIVGAALAGCGLIAAFLNRGAPAAHLTRSTNA